MRQLLPRPAAEVDPLALYSAAGRTPPAGRPWVMVNMIASVDGAVTVGGASGGLGSPADRTVFAAARACADWILAGAGTVRAERYRLPRPSAAARAARLAAGRSERPGLAVVSASLDLDPDLPMLADRRPGEARPLILTGPNAPADRAERLAETAEVVRLEPTIAAPAEEERGFAPAGKDEAGKTEPTAAGAARGFAPVGRDEAGKMEPAAGAAQGCALAGMDGPGRLGSPAAALGELGRRGAKVVLAEGGPTLNAWLAEAGMIDELCLSVAPVLAGGPSPRLIHGAALAGPINLELAHLLEDDGMLFARYLALR